MAASAADSQFLPATTAPLAYVLVPVRDAALARAFYAPVLSGVGAQELSDLAEPGKVWFGQPGRPPFVAFSEVPEGADGPQPSNVLLAFAAPSPAAVDAIYAEALAQGAEDDGAPAVRSREPDFYVAYLRDWDRNRFSIFHRAAS